MITIVNYGLGNLGSVMNMFKRIGAKAEITADVDVLARAEKILLPGVGAFDPAMQKIGEIDGLRDVLDQKAMVEKVPFLGICLGMQIMGRSSEEGEKAGLGYIDFACHRFRFDDPSLKVPHMGWNFVKPTNPSELTEGLDEQSRFYFVHSFFARCANEKDVSMRCQYGHDFDVILKKDNLFAAQFHPEKSHRFGMQLFSNFAKI